MKISEIEEARKELQKFPLEVRVWAKIEAAYIRKMFEEEQK